MSERRGRPAARPSSLALGALVRCVTLVALAVAAAVDADAAEWRAAPTASQEIGYDDNVGFNSGSDKEASFVETSRADLTLGGRNQVLDLSLTGEVSATRVPTEPGLDSNDQLLRLGATRTGQRFDLGLDGSIVRDTVGDDEVDAETGEGAANVRNNNERRLTGSLEPRLTWRPTRLQSVTLSAGIERRVYPNNEDSDDDGLASGVVVTSLSDGAVLEDENDLADRDTPEQRQDYWRYTTGLTWLRSLTPRTAAGLGTTLLHLDQPRQNLQLASLQGVLRHQLRPRLAIDLSAGPSLVRSEQRQQAASSEQGFFNDGTSLVAAQQTTFRKETDEELDVGYLADAGITWSYVEGGDLELRFSHSVQPSGTSGQAVNRDQASFNLTHRATRLVRLFARGRIVRDENVSSDGNSGSDTSIRFEPGVGWQVAEDLELSLRYRWRYKDQDDGGDVASNAVLVRLDLRLPELKGSW